MNIGTKVFFEGGKVLLTDILRKTIAKKKDPYLFISYDGNLDFSTIPDFIGLYIHIPFCKTLCPYCPYNKTKYDPHLAAAYKEALLKELALLKEHLTGKTISSLYFGGGTPTLMIKELEEIILWLHQNLTLKGDIGIEIHPNEVEDNKIKHIKELGVNLVSIGVQTFDDKKLKFLGRNYTGEMARKAIEAVQDFDCVDVDIMFNLPNQTEEEIEVDLKTCFDYQVDQISIYPLILFPMTPLHKIVKNNNYKTFNGLQEYSLLNNIEQVALGKGYEKTSIWTYGKPQGKRYTSVTRESFIGVGASATSLFGNYFYLNTFDTKAYIQRLNENVLPINLINTMSPREAMVFWLFWRCYDTSIDLERFNELFGRELGEEFPIFLKVLKNLRLAERSDSKRLQLTKKGSYLFHLVEKHYSVNYLNNMWSACMKNPWLDSFKL